MGFFDDYEISIEKTTYEEDEIKKYNDKKYITAREKVYRVIKDIINHNYENITPNEFTTIITKITYAVYRANTGDTLTFIIKGHTLIIKII